MTLGLSVEDAQAQAEALTLEEVLAHAEQHAPSLVAARARLGLGDAAMEGAKPVLRDNPEVELGVGPHTTTGYNPSLDLKLRVQQRIEISGQRSARIDAAHAVRALEDERLAAARFAVRINVRASFYEVLLAHERAESARRIEAVQTRVVEIAAARLEAGDIGSLGVRLAEADLAQALQARIEAEGVEQGAQLRLAALAGLSVETPPTVVGPLPKPVTTLDATVLVERARTAQPARRVALAELAEREKRMQVTSRESWIGPAVGFELAHEDRNQNVALATISVPLPLFARNQGPRALARAERDISHAELDAIDQALPVRVRAWIVAVEASGKRIAVYQRDVLPRFQENLALIGRAFELGEIDALEVSTARARLVEAERTALDSYDDYLAAITNLQLETGTELPDEKVP
jgi:cobalt-zinc-cadmium efflux system outer membrane protein